MGHRKLNVQPDAREPVTGKKSVLFGIVLVFVLYGMSLGRTFTQASPLDHDSVILTAPQAIPGMLFGALAGFITGLLTEKRCERIPWWMFPLTFALLPLWVLNILVFPGSPP